MSLLQGGDIGVLRNGETSRFELKVHTELVQHICDILPPNSSVTVTVQDLESLPQLPHLGRLQLG
jgi:hypothetical protein